MKNLIFVLLVLSLFVVACQAPNQPKQAVGYVDNSGDPAKLDYDPVIYTIKGEVVGDINSVVRQSAPAQGSVSGYSTGSWGYVGGSFVGPQISGKNFVRLLVQSSDCSLAKYGELVILKVEDTKATALLPGDIVTFRCRVEYEVLTAVLTNETFSKDKQVKEIDWCRFAVPTIGTTIEPVLTP